MRSSATAGLTPQQLLDRRRAQNKLAQRRFREKARMSRSGGPSSLAYYLDDTPAGLSTFPPHLDLASTTSLSRNKTTPRERSASSDSSSTSSCASFSSQGSSPSSSCTELTTPTMPSFGATRSTEPTIVGNTQVAPVFVADLAKLEPVNSNASLYMPPPPAPSFMSNVYPALDATLLHSAPLLPPSQPLTYSGLAGPSASLRNIGLKMVGMHADPFLMSQPLPSPSISLGPSGKSSSLPNSMLFAPPYAPRRAQEESQSYPSTSFENLLRITSQPSFCSSASDDASIQNEPCLSPSSASPALPKLSVDSDAVTFSLLAEGLHMSNDTAASQCASSHMDKAVSRYADRVDSGKHQHPVQSVTLTSQPFARVVELIGTHFGLTRCGEGLAQLLSRLQLYGKLDAHTETSKGLVFDAAINWDTMGSNMLPTTEQLLYPHRAFVDACLPWPSVRSRLLKHALTNPVCEEELALDLLLSILVADDALSSVRVYGNDVLDPEAWELSQRLYSKWWGLFDDSIVRRTNWWRRQRGLGDLCAPQPDDTASESERQGLGTGSLDQVHHLATTLFP